MFIELVVPTKQQVAENKTHTYAFPNATIGEPSLIGKLPHPLETDLLEVATYFVAKKREVATC